MPVNLYLLNTLLIVTYTSFHWGTSSLHLLWPSYKAYNFLLLSNLSFFHTSLSFIVASLFASIWPQCHHYYLWCLVCLLHKLTDQSLVCQQSTLMFLFKFPKFFLDKRTNWNGVHELVYILSANLTISLDSIYFRNCF